MRLQLGCTGYSGLQLISMIFLCSKAHCHFFHGGMHCRGEMPTSATLKAWPALIHCVQFTVNYLQNLCGPQTQLSLVLACIPSTPIRPQNTRPILLRNRKCIDAKAIKKTTLLDWIEKLPPGYFVTCDCTYSISEHLIGLYSGAE